MNCLASQKQLLRAQDEALHDQQHSTLAAHLSSCPQCSEFEASLRQISADIKNEAASVPVPDADETWQGIQSRLQPTGESETTSKRFAPLIWITAPLAAAAAFAFAFLPSHSTSDFDSVAMSEASATQVDYVETDNPNATTMVYVDNQSGWLVVWTDDTSVTNG